MARPAINPGQVDWAGENPGLYLREQEDGPYTCLASFFRVLYSPHGPGCALILLWDPQREHPRNGLYTDNPPLATWLRDEFAVHFSAFQGNALLPALAPRPLTRSEREGDPSREYSEVVEAEGHRIKLTWRALSAPFIVELPVERSATGRHEMFSLFFDAREGEVIFDGERGRGRAFPRDFQGRRSSTAFLAFSETWVRP